MAGNSDGPQPKKVIDGPQDVEEYEVARLFDEDVLLCPDAGDDYGGSRVPLHH